MTSPTPDNPLATPVQFVKGVGPNRAELFAKLGIETVEDLLWTLPRDVLDLSDVRAASALEEDVFQSVRGQVVDIDGKQLSRGRTLIAVLLDNQGHYVRGNWFNQPWMRKKFTPGETVMFSGKPKRRGGRWEFSHPQVKWLGEDDTAHGGVQPRYSLTEGLSMDDVRRAMRAAVDGYVEHVPDYLPESFRQEQKLPDIREALKQIHTPNTIGEYERGRWRVLFDDLFEFQLGLAIKRRAWKTQESAPRLPTTAKIDARIRRLFPFALTKGQNTAVREIAADLASGRAMHRLLQADVGAGKTAVALYAILVTVAAGFQSVLMAPTEVLASQHWNTIDEALAHSRVERRLLTGDLTAAQRARVLQEIAEGSVQLVVGTQAVIQKGVAFRNLGLAVIDEQHKFGVMQRAHFSVNHENDDANSPHVLVMTATPIPRSLCLTQFGDLDVSTISDMPPDRQQVVTSRIRGPANRQRVWKFIREQLTAGRQAFVVCPRVESNESEDGSGEPIDAEGMFRQLEANELRDYRVGLVHGQMDRKLKADAMDAFRDGKTQVLVSTTVVEVGVDVPNATIMVIIKAEQFGLSQLHQLRGRISRGKFQGYCFLFSETESDDAGQRLFALESTADGFRIAEADFELRGPGDVLGTRQHGELPLRVADIRRDTKVLKSAREAAFGITDSGRLDEPEFAPLKNRVLDRFGKLLDLPQSG